MSSASRQFNAKVAAVRAGYRTRTVCGARLANPIRPDIRVAVEVARLLTKVDHGTGSGAASSLIAEGKVGARLGQGTWSPAKAGCGDLSGNVAVLAATEAPRTQATVVVGHVPGAPLAVLEQGGAGDQSTEVRVHQFEQQIIDAAFGGRTGCDPCDPRVRW